MFKVKVKVFKRHDFRTDSNEIFELISITPIVGQHSLVIHFDRSAKDGLMLFGPERVNSRDNFYNFANGMPERGFSIDRELDGDIETPNLLQQMLEDCGVGKLLDASFENTRQFQKFIFETGVAYGMNHKPPAENDELVLSRLLEEELGSDSPRGTW